VLVGVPFFGHPHRSYDTSSNNIDSEDTVSGTLSSLLLDLSIPVATILTAKTQSLKLSVACF